MLEVYEEQNRHSQAQNLWFYLADCEWIVPSVSLVAKAFVEITPCASVIIELNQEILLNITKITIMTWDDNIMTYYDVMNLCQFYVVFGKKRSKICLFSI